MKKTSLLSVLIILFVTNIHAQTNWGYYKIDDKLSVKLPVQPEKLQEGSVIAASKDTVIFIITVVNFVKTAQMDSVTLAPLLPTQGFADEIKTGMLGQMPGFMLGDIKVGKWKGHYCYNVDGGNDAKKLKDYTFMVIIGNNMYSLTAILPDNKVTTAKDYFFNSLVLN